MIAYEIAQFEEKGVNTRKLELSTNGFTKKPSNKDAHTQTFTSFSWECHAVLHCTQKQESGWLIVNVQETRPASPGKKRFTSVS